MKILFAVTVCFLSFWNVCYSQCWEWSTKLDSTMVFSSPRFVDLNNDRIQDIVIGAGNEFNKTSNGVVAINGQNGNILWKVSVPTQIYTSALFQDISGDKIPDVFIGGRNAAMYAIDGSSGKIIWQYWTKGLADSREAGVFNFFTTQWLDDQNSDGFQDLLVANGGDAFAKANQKNRPQGNIWIVSGKTGEKLVEVQVPHEREIYYAPHLNYNNGKENPNIIFGTGGEAVDGKLWETSLEELKKNELNNARIITTDDEKGFIVNSIMADLNADGKLDIINSRMSGKIAAYDALTHNTIWSHSFPGYEGYTAPTVGFFTNDDIPDVFVFMAHGTFPNYDHFTSHLIDGKLGTILYTDTLAISQFASALAIDVTGDLKDEAVYLRNYFNPETNEVTNQLEVVEFTLYSRTPLGTLQSGIGYSSTPSIADIDRDGNLEIVYAYSNSFGSKEEYSIIQCVELEMKIENISFPGYLGEKENGIFDKKARILKR